ncbi:MAG: hypothetical protein FWC65_06140 [Treponema sp.]|nr:hypothetical protein [Treponema sp.]
MKAEEIRAALQDVSPDTLADALAIVFTEGKAPSQAVAGMDKPELANFAQAIMYLKKNYDFDELEQFTTEADLVYVNAGDRRILLTDRMNTPQPPPIHGADSLSTGHDNTADASDSGRFSNLEL